MNARSFTPLKYGNNHTKKYQVAHEVQKATGKTSTLWDRKLFWMDQFVPVTNIAPNVPAKYNNPLNSIIAYTPT